MARIRMLCAVRDGHVFHLNGPHANDHHNRTGTVTSRLKPLRVAGLVKAKGDSGDTWQQWVLTDAGRAALAEFAGTP